MDEPTASNPTATPESSVIYTLLIYTPDSCYDTLYQPIDVGPELILDLDNDVPLCDEDEGALIGFEGDPSFNYSWTPAQGLDDPNKSNPLAMPLVSTTYHLTVDNGFCVMQDSVNVVKPNVIIEADYLADVTHDCDHVSIALLNNSSQSASSFEWYVNGALVSQDPDLIDDYDLDHSLSIVMVVTDQYGCSDTAFFSQNELELEVKKHIPNTFSPNGDGINDCFYFTKDEIDPDCYKLLIYNRWGERVFQTNDPLNCWKGRVDNIGSDLNEGVYYYILYLKTLTLTGFIELLK